MSKTSKKGPAMGHIPNPVMTRLGLQNTDEGDTMQKIQEINGFRFTVPPANNYHSQQAEQKFSLLAGAINPIFNPDRFDALRRRLQTSDKKDRESSMQSIAVLYSEELSKAFAKAENVDYAEVERHYYPNYVAPYETALRAHGLKKPLIWRPGQFSTLENLARLPLDRCSDKREVQMSFEEWYNLFWNHYSPFSPLAFTCMCTAQSMIFCRELVDGLADYIAWRHSTLDESVRKNPILYFGPRIGKYGALLNATKKIPVPIIHIHENPNTNPYLLAIPNDKQAEFKPHPIQKMSYKLALEKFEPGIVLFSEMKTHTDETAAIRSTGSVREYITVGVPDSYAEGSGWETWGYSRYKPKDVGSTPSYILEGWGRLNLPHLSRYVIHKLDSPMQMGMGSVVTFMRRPVIPPFHVRAKNFIRRLRPFY